MSQATMVHDVLSGKLAVKDVVTLKGWVRTKRDSKAGLSFINLHDGSCFNPVQVVAPNSLNNYDEDVLALTAGCSIEVTGEVVESPGKGQAFEIQATEIKVIGLVEASDAEKPKAARAAGLASRVNTMLSIPLLFFMATGSHGGLL